MAKFVYQLAFNPNATPSSMQVHIFVTQNRDIESWYLAFPGNYIFKSDKFLIDFQSQFTHFFGQSLFTISYITAGLLGGLLPQSVWEWVNGSDVPSLELRR